MASTQTVWFRWRNVREDNMGLVLTQIEPIAIKIPSLPAQGPRSRVNTGEPGVFIGPRVGRFAKKIMIKSLAIDIVISGGLDTFKVYRHIHILAFCYLIIGSIALASTKGLLS